MSACVFAGSFDPPTRGHESVISRCVARYGKVFVVIGENKDKECLFTPQERKKMLETLFQDTPSVIVVNYADYKQDYAKFLLDNQITTYVRGIRNQTDFEYEKGQEEFNKIKYPFITTEYMHADEEFVGFSSSLVKKKIESGEDFSELVPESVLEEINLILKERKA